MIVFENAEEATIIVHESEELTDTSPEMAFWQVMEPSRLW